MRDQVIIRKDYYRKSCCKLGLDKTLQGAAVSGHEQIVRLLSQHGLTLTLLVA